MEEGDGLALDNSGDTRDFVVARASHVVHYGRVHSHPARGGDRRDFDPSDSGTQADLILGGCPQLERSRKSRRSSGSHPFFRSDRAIVLPAKSDRGQRAILF